MVMVARNNWTEIVGELFKGYHRFLAMSAEKQCPNRLGFYVVDHSPIAVSANAASQCAGARVTSCRLVRAQRWRDPAWTQLQRRLSAWSFHNTISMFGQETHPAEATLKTERIAACS